MPGQELRVRTETVIERSVSDAATPPDAFDRPNCLVARLLAMIGSSR
jgi:hypothetical protein